MIGFNIQTVFYKAKGNSESAIQNQINDLINIVNGFHNISPYIEVWYVNNATSTKPPLDYPFPSEKATKYLYNLRKKDEFEFFDLWNAHVDNESYCDISYSFSGLRMEVSNKLSSDQVEEIIKVIVENISCKYLYLSSMFTMKNTVFEHRHPTSPICFIPKIIDDNAVPFLVKKINIENELNTGSILIFDKNLFDESDLMKKKINEVAIALVALDVLPEYKDDRDFYSDLDP